MVGDNFSDAGSFVSALWDGSPSGAAKTRLEKLKADIKALEPTAKALADDLKPDIDNAGSQLADRLKWERTEKRLSVVLEKTGSRSIGALGFDGASVEAFFTYKDTAILGITVKAADDNLRRGRFRMFQVSITDQDATLRDESANVAWALERTVQTSSDDPRSRSDEPRAGPWPPADRYRRLNSSTSSKPPYRSVGFRSCRSRPMHGPERSSCAKGPCPITTNRSAFCSIPLPSLSKKRKFRGRVCVCGACPPCCAPPTDATCAGLPGALPQVSFY